MHIGPSFLAFFVAHSDILTGGLYPFCKTFNSKNCLEENEILIDMYSIYLTFTSSVSLNTGCRLHSQ